MFNDRKGKTNEKKNRSRCSYASSSNGIWSRCLYNAITSSSSTRSTTRKINGTTVNASGIDIIREEQSNGGESRGDAVLDIVRAAAESATNPDKKAAMINVALSEYSKGDIIMTPQGSFVGLLATEGIENILH